MMRVVPLLAALVFCLSGLVGVASAQQTLTVCLEEDSPPLSFKFRSRQGGFDHGVAEEVARRLDMGFAVQWFEAENDEENVPVWEANALLSDGLCDVVGGYPLVASSLGKPETDQGAIPEYDGMKRSERGRLVKLGVLAATDPYNRVSFGVFLGPVLKDLQVTGLHDLEGRRIGYEVETMASVLVHRYRGGVLIPTAVSMRQSEGVLPALADGELDAAVLEVHKFDNFMRRNADAPIHFSGYVHPLGINMGFAILERDADLASRINAALTAMKSDGTLEKLAQKWQMTFIKPQPPKVLKRITPAMLAGE
ncbi:substrate-binding periplasmic protein [Minwuia sp.]|uniref:substrate-binding periplasmic protein n=1 Tax=Minwuia sp. TaxID=2493630 RepID=UPI003A93B35F